MRDKRSRTMPRGAAARLCQCALLAVAALIVYRSLRAVTQSPAMPEEREADHHGPSLPQVGLRLHRVVTDTEAMCVWRAEDDALSLPLLPILLEEVLLSRKLCGHLHA